LSASSRPHEAAPRQVLEQPRELALAAPHDGSKHLKARPLRQLEHLVDDLLGGLPGDGAAAVVTVGPADACKQQPQIVVDLGDCPYGRAWVARRRLLVDRDRGGKALDEVDVGLVHLTEELARIRRQRLDVAPLALGVDRIEGKRGLARPRDAREHDERVAREVEMDVSEVVLAGATDDKPSRRLAKGGCGHRASC
jgi:hypothetical protein